MRPMLTVICTIVLLLACGGAPGGEEPDPGSADGTPETGSHQSATQSAAGTLVASSREEACRTQMSSLATAEAMYFTRFDRYSDARGLESSGMFPGAGAISCPSSGTAYVFSLSFRDDVPSSYTIECPEGHGSIRDGLSLWE
jgi:hypothetical protein